MCELSRHAFVRACVQVCKCASVCVCLFVARTQLSSTLSSFYMFEEPLSEYGDKQGVPVQRSAAATASISLFPTSPWA
jgi:hypothetical protein